MIFFDTKLILKGHKFIKELSSPYLYEEIVHRHDGFKKSSLTTE